MAPGSPVLLVAFARPADAAPAVAGRAMVVDGDTFDIAGTRIRLWGVDAPEAAQTCTSPDGGLWACGAQASAALRARLGTGVTRCEPQYLDPGGRQVARCVVAGRDLAGQLAVDGWVLDFPRYSGGACQADERQARARRAGVWRGTITPLWLWRTALAERRNQAADRAGPDGCRIKGAINAAGVRIAHAPGQRDYAAVRIDPARGERWFCSQAQAAAAGWRAGLNGRGPIGSGRVGTAWPWPIASATVESSPPGPVRRAGEAARPARGSCGRPKTTPSIGRRVRVSPASGRQPLAGFALR